MKAQNKGDSEQGAGLEKIKDVEISPVRRLKGIVAIIITLICVAMSLFHIYVLGYRAIDPWYFRGMHVVFAGVLVFAFYPGWEKAPKDRLHPLDLLFILLTVAPFVYIVIEFDEWIYRVGVVPNTLDLIFSIMFVIAILEMTRRTTGLALTIIASLFILYGYLGPYMPGLLYHRGYTWPRIFTYLFSLEGILSIPISVSATYVFIFILFGAFLQISGAGRFFIDLAFSIAGRARGGPAKVAVIASAFFGTISGSSAANVVGTGTFSIPLMKKTGYQAHFAGAVEAVASTGGQIMPPIMGAGAFIMAEILGIPYLHVAAAAAIPAILYFAAVYFMVDMEAVRQGLRGLPKEQLPKAKEVLKDVYLLLPLFVLIYMLAVVMVSAVRAGLFAILSCLLVSMVRKESRMGPKKIFQALSEGAKGAISIVATCAAAGIIIGVLSQTGLGMKFATIILNYSMGYLPLALVLAMVVAIILGMGVPTTAAYAICAAVITTALVQMGAIELAAHLFVFYFACISAITPPVALAAYAGAAISKSPPMKVGFTALKLGIAAFIVPYMFVYGPALLLKGAIWEVLLAFVSSFIGIYALAGAAQGWFMGSANLVTRVLLLAAALLLIKPGWTTDLFGLAVFGVAAIIQRLAAQRAVLVYGKTSSES